jgi:hypothetical protein
VRQTDFFARLQEEEIGQVLPAMGNTKYTNTDIIITI